MAYSTNKLATVAECDKVLDLAKREKAVLDYKLTGLAIDTDENQRSNAQLTADLLSVNAQVTAFKAAFDSLPEGAEKTEMGSKLRKLNDRKENLEERAAKVGTTGLLLTEMERGMLEKQVEELGVFIAAVTARKAAL
jgi:hypothetical protein